MTPQEIRMLFPIEINITEEDRTKAIEMGGLHKLGKLLLEQNLPQKLHESIFWGLSIGTVDGIKIKISKFEIYNGRKIEVPIYMDKNFTDNVIKFELR